jgi:hypothetical protein
MRGIFRRLGASARLMTAMTNKTLTQAQSPSLIHVFAAWARLDRSGACHRALRVESVTLSLRNHSKCVAFSIVAKMPVDYSLRLGLTSLVKFPGKALKKS